MKKTLLTAVLALSLASLSACQTAKVQSNQATAQRNGKTTERNIAEVPAEALELVFKNLAENSANMTEGTFDAKVLDLVNANKTALGITTDEKITSMSELSEQVGNRPGAFLNKFARLNLGSLNITKGQLRAAADQEFQNAEATTGVKTMAIGDLQKPMDGPISAASFQAATDAKPEDVTAIMTAAKSLESKVGHPVVGGGCANLRSPASIHNLAEVVTNTDAALSAGATQDAVDTELETELQKITNTTKDDAHERLCELANTSRCGVLKVGSKTCVAE
jgi:hypothetical protein